MITIAQAAKDCLIANGFNRVAYGDAWLLHEIAEAAGMKHEAWLTEARVLNALDGSPLFEKSYFQAVRGKARVFTVLEEQG